MSPGTQEEGHAQDRLPERSGRKGFQPHSRTLPGLRPHYRLIAGSACSRPKGMYMSLMSGEGGTENLLSGGSGWFLWEWKKVWTSYYCWKCLVIVDGETTLEEI